MKPLLPPFVARHGVLLSTFVTLATTACGASSPADTSTPVASAGAENMPGGAGSSNGGSTSTGTNTAGMTSAAGATSSTGGAGTSTGDTPMGGTEPTGEAGTTAGGSTSVSISVPIDLAPGEVCPREDRIGSFRLYLGEDRTIFSGAVSNAVAPPSVSAVLAEEGTCQLLGPPPLFCEPECGSGQTCNAEGTCITTPENISVGDVSVSGLASALEVSPHAITGTYSSSILDPFPGYETGAEISLSTTGADGAAPFTLDGWGVPQMSTTLTVLPVARDTAASLTWDATGADTTRSAVFIVLTVNAHGGTTGWIECSAPDTGSFDVPAGLVTQLMDLGLSGFPRATLGRRSTDAVQLDAGCVDLRVASEITVEIEVEGLISCNTDEECPDGQTCSVELACGE